MIKILKHLSFLWENQIQPFMIHYDKELCTLLQNINFSQTFGISRLGTFRIKSINRVSLFMKICGEGVETSNCKKSFAKGTGT